MARVVDELFASSYGDDALFALGEIALERGEYHGARVNAGSESARSYVPPDGLPLWLWQRSKSTSAGTTDAIPNDLHRGPEGGANWLAYPDTNLDLADMHHRLVLVSILKGATERAKSEYESLFVRLSRNARGNLAGRDGVYRETIAPDCCSSAGEWPRSITLRRATMFAGGTQEELHCPGRIRLAIVGLARAGCVGRKTA